MAPSIDEFEDLTQFADESFDTEEVDLFEFTDDEDSPLLRLKSIVLSLDWDITEEILTELNEELASLRALWKDDKVAQIYLQGMENVGKYMQAEGVYAHPNAIKLLLTLYHNYEKIISSPNISGENITAMLKADIRKFKVLQYQISSLKNVQSAGREEAAKTAATEQPAARTVASPSPAPPAAQDSTAPGPLRSMEATILGLEWEVTDEGLEKFSKESAELRSYLSHDKEAQVLIQGLQALGAYIREQKNNAHPDSFTILHSFYDALKMLIESPLLGAEQRRHILLEQIGSLNSLKEVVARSAAAKQEEAAAEEAAESAAAVEEDEDSIANLPAGALAEDDELDFSVDAEDEQLGSDFSFNDEDDALPAAKPAAPSRPAAPAHPAAGGDDEDDEFDDNLFSSGGGVIPALADAEEEGGFSDSLATADLGAERTAELDEKLDSFFNFDDELEKTAPPKKAATTQSDAAPPAKPSLAHIFDDAPDEEEDDSAELDSSFFNFEDEQDEAPAAAQPAAGSQDAALNFADDDSIFGDESEELSPLSPTAEKEKGPSLSKAAEQDEEDDELDAFFNFDDELDAPPPAKAQVKRAALPAAAAQEQSVRHANGIEDDQNSPAVALADKQKQPAVKQPEEDELGSEFESFFSFDEEVTPPQPETTAKPAAEEESEDVLSMDSSLFGGEDDECTPAVALADEQERPAAEQLEEDELGSEFESFFSFDEEVTPPQPETVAKPAVEEEPEDVLSMDSGLFGGEDDENGTAEEAKAEEDMLDSGSLDSFFSFDEETARPQPETAASPAAEKELEIGREKAAEIKSKLDSLFSFGDDSLTNELAVDSQDDLPDLDDDLITPLDDESSVQITHENLFGADKDSDSTIHLESVTEEEEPAIVAAESLTGAQDNDSFFSFDSGLDGEADTADAGLTSDFTEASGDDEDHAPAAEEPEEAFFSDIEDTDDGFTEEQEVAAEEEPTIQDELFGLAKEDELETEADSLAGTQDDDAFFGFTSKLDSEAEAADSEHLPDFPERNEDEDDIPAAEELEKVVAASLADDTEEDLLLGEEDEADSQSLFFGQDDLPDPFASSAVEYAEEESDNTADSPAGSNALHDKSSLGAESTDEASFASLTTAVSALPLMPSSAQLQQIAELVSAVRRETSLSAQQSIVLTLLDSSAVLLVQAPENAGDSGTVVMQELAAALEQAEEPEVLAGAVNCYTAWQQDFFAELLRRHPQLPEESSTEGVGVALGLVREEFSQLKQELFAEFSQLRQEMLTLRQ